MVYAVYAQLFWSNDQALVSEALTSNGTPITTGTVKVALLTVDGATVLIASGAMTHVGSPNGTWERNLQAEDIDAAIARTVTHVLQRIEVGSPVDATFERVLEMAERRSES